MVFTHVSGLIKIPNFLENIAKCFIRSETTAHELVVVLKLFPCDEVAGVSTISTPECHKLLEGVSKLAQDFTAVSRAIRHLGVAVRIVSVDHLIDV